MSFDAQRLYELLPASCRIRDAEQGGAILALITIIAEQAQVMEEDLAQLYDDLFIETCASWVVPYIADLIGLRASRFGVGSGSTRAEVANTLRYRRAKGTLAVIEQLARDTTGWHAHAVEYFQLLSTTQFLNHLRPQKGAFVNLRAQGALDRISSPFDEVARTADTREIQNGRGAFNIPNIGIFLWRLQSLSLTGTPAFAVDAHRFLFSPLGIETQLFNLSATALDGGTLSSPSDFPIPIDRRLLNAQPDNYYGANRSILLIVDGKPVVPAAGQHAADLITACDLSDFGSGWAHVPKNQIAIDPELGRIAFPASQSPQSVVVTFHYGFSAELGGGEYPRAATFDTSLSPVRQTHSPAKIQDGLNALAGGGVLEIVDSATYIETLSLVAGAHRLAVRALDNGSIRRRPLLRLSGDFVISGTDGGEVTLNGLLIAGTVRVKGSLSRLNLLHCTLAPSTAAPSLIVESTETQVTIDHTIMGAIQTADSVAVNITSSIADAQSESRPVYAALDGSSAAGALSVENSTVIGKVHTKELILASNSIILARRADADTWVAPVISERRQRGCVRFSFVPLESLAPRRYRCQPVAQDSAALMRPQFNSVRYGDAAYCQLSMRCVEEIRRGADDGAEMGAFHDLLQPQRLAQLKLRLGEYLRLGLNAGTIYAT
jgi:hypothetical protein